MRKGRVFAIVFHRDEVIDQDSAACSGKVNSIDAHFIDSVCFIITEYRLPDVLRMFRENLHNSW